MQYWNEIPLKRQVFTYCQVSLKQLHCSSIGQILYVHTYVSLQR